MIARVPNKAMNQLTSAALRSLVMAGVRMNVVGYRAVRCRLVETKGRFNKECEG